MVSMRAIVLACALTCASAASPSLLSRVRRTNACQSEQLQGQKPEASRGTACSKCTKFTEAHKDSDWVKPNAPLCTKCYSVKSSCDNKQFAWSCYDPQQQFKVFQKNTDMEKFDEPKEMDDAFVDKDPQEC